MNYSTAIFLINSKVRAVMATYEADDPGGRAPAPRTMFKTLDDRIQIGDFVIVPTNTRHNMTVCKVVEVDVDVDFESSVCVAWVIAKVDRTVHELYVAREAEAIATIKSAEKTKKREDLRAAILADTPALRALAISDASPVPQPFINT